MHRFGLADAMAAVLGLLVHCGVPIRVVEDHTVCTCEVYTNATATCRGDETKDLLVEVELIHEPLSHLGLYAAIQAYISIAMEV
jgi:hypothetical protein